jgi:hypothetical protein
MGSLTYIHPIFRRTTPEQDELLSDKAELDETIDHIVLLAVRRLATTSAAEHVGGIDKERAAELIRETIEDIMFDARRAVEGRLEDISQ